MVAALFSHPLVWQYVLAWVIASGAVVVAAKLHGGKDVTTALPAYFAWCEQHDTYTNAVGIIRFARQRPWMWIIVAYAAAPSIAAVVVAAGSDGRASLRELLKRLAPWRSGLAVSALVTYAVILVVHLAVSAWYIRIDRAAVAAGDQAAPAALLRRSRPRVVGRLVLGLFLDEGGSLEELGWRGFVVPLLLASLANRLTTSLLIAVLWWAWHLPREIPALLHRPKWKKFVHDQSVFLIACAAIAVTCTEVVVRTGSVWPAVMVHAAGNVWSKALGNAMWNRYKQDVRSWICLAIAVVVAISWLFT